MSTGCMTTTGLLICATGFGVLVTSCAGPSAHPVENHASSAQSSPGLPNLREIAPGVFIGGAPDPTVGYDSLAHLGVRTVLAVDATRPNLEALSSRGIGSVHVPIEYSGVSTEQRLALTKALATQPRPIYIHCHHGKHRGPAAACVALLGTGEIDQHHAEQILEDAGTSPSYPGLFESVREARPHPEPGTIDAELPEIAQTGSMAEAMARIERAMDSLRIIEGNGWAVPETHPDLAPVALAGQIEQTLRGLCESEDATTLGPEFIRLMSLGADHASELESRIQGRAQHTSPPSTSGLASSCTGCHDTYRNTPPLSQTPGPRSSRGSFGS